MYSFKGEWVDHLYISKVVNITENLCIINLVERTFLEAHSPLLPHPRSLVHLFCQDDSPCTVAIDRVNETNRIERDQIHPNVRLRIYSISES
jgi:hypothetical protein